MLWSVRDGSRACRPSACRSRPSRARGYTAFAHVTQPEHVIRFLQEYHALLGPIIAQHGGTLERFTGDGVMVFFHEPIRVYNVGGLTSARVPPSPDDPNRG